MFYSHEILTDRKHGVATIWLVATLGSRSSLKKVTRKAILDVNLPKACESITDPIVPMALRLQGSLLYGISRVFSQQCGYILTDAQGLHEKMRGVNAMMLREQQIDLNVASTKPDQLNLPIDPTFDIGFDLTFDLNAFQNLSDGSERSSMLSSAALASSHSSMSIGGPEQARLLLPSLDTSGIELLDFDLDRGAGTNSAVGSGALDLAESLRDDPAVYDNSEFLIGDDGELMTVEEMQATLSERNPDVTPAARLAQDVLVAGSGIGDQNVGDVDEDDFNDNLVIQDDDDLDFPSIQTPLPAVAVEPEEQPDEPQQAHLDEQSEQTETTAEAPQRVSRIPKSIQIDQVSSLSNRELSDWNSLYLENMSVAREEKIRKQAPAQARRNAAFWILDQGIGGVEVNFGSDLVTHPFAAFSGQALLDALTGKTSSLAGDKRARSSSRSSEQSNRRVRQRSLEPQTDLTGNVPLFGEDDAFPLHGDEDIIESEVGRQAPASLGDHSSQMPWNVYSRHGSARTHGSEPYGITSSVGGIGGLNYRPSSVAGRRSRVVSSSPLVGKGQPLQRMNSLDPSDNGLFPSNLDVNDIDDVDVFPAGDLDEDFQLYGPAAAVSTQTAAQSQWLTATLETEAQNFLTFVQARTQDQMNSGDPAIKTITFAELLPPETNSKIVGAQALLHVLSLATKGLIDIKQDEPFNDITLNIGEHIQAAQPEETIHEDEEQAVAVQE